MNEFSALLGNNGRMRVWNIRSFLACRSGNNTGGVSGFALQCLSDSVVPDPHPNRQRVEWIERNCGRQRRICRSIFACRSTARCLRKPTNSAAILFSRPAHRVAVFSSFLVHPPPPLRSPICGSTDDCGRQQLTGATRLDHSSLPDRIPVASTRPRRYKRESKGESRLSSPDCGGG